MVFMHKIYMVLDTPSAPSLLITTNLINEVLLISVSSEGATAYTLCCLLKTEKEYLQSYFFYFEIHMGKII